MWMLVQTNMIKSGKIRLNSSMYVTIYNNNKTIKHMILESLSTSNLTKELASCYWKTRIVHRNIEKAWVSGYNQNFLIFLLITSINLPELA